MRSAIRQNAGCVTADDVALPTLPKSVVSPPAPKVKETRRLISNAAALAAGRGCSLIAAIVILPRVVEYLTPATYGAWASITSSVALLAFADLGIGQSLVNPLARAMRDGDRASAQRLVSTSLALVFGCALAVLLVSVGAVLFLPWKEWLSLGREESSVVTTIALIQAGLFSATIALSTGTYVRLAQHKSARLAFSMMTGALVAAGTTLMAIHADAGIIIVTTAASSGLLLGALITNVDLFLSEPTFHLRRHAIRRSVANSSFRQGLLFSVQSASAVVAYSTDTVVVSNALGPVAVAQYSVTARGPLAILALIQAALLPIWPIVAQRAGQGQALRRIVSKAVTMFGVPAAMAAVAFFYTADVVVAYLGAELVTLDRQLVLALCCWIIVGTLGTIVGHTLVGAGLLALQAKIAATMAVANLALSISLVRHLGVSGVMWATVISYTMVVFPMSAIGFVRRRA